MKPDELFRETSDTQLKYLYDQLMEGREDGLRPRDFDEYIREVKESYSMNFGEAWRLTEKLFWDEVGRRCFEKIFN